MGADISLHTEVKINGRWEHSHEIDVPRYYELFGKLAGVRGGGEIASPRGLPSDINPLTKWYIEQQEDHSFSYLTGIELKKLKKWEDKEERQWTLTDKIKDYWNQDIMYTKDFRIIFGFDS